MTINAEPCDFALCKTGEPTLTGGRAQLRWWVRGDLDGFFGLFSNSMAIYFAFQAYRLAKKWNCHYLGRRQEVSRNPCSPC